LLPKWEHGILSSQMRLLSRSTLRDFWRIHHDAERPLRAWIAEIEQGEWRSAVDVKQLYKSASFVGNDRIVFNIGGNKYRLIVMVKYANTEAKRNGIIFVRFIGTHREYDKIDVAKV